MANSTNYELRDIRQDLNSKRPLKSQPAINSVNGDSLGVMIVDGSQNNENLGGRRPLDRYNIVFIILLIHGIGTLMPWNMFINAEEYFRKYKLSPVANVTSDQQLDEGLADLRKNFLSYLSLASQIPNLLFNALNLLVNIGSGNPRLRVNLTLGIEALIFAITIILATVDSTQWPTAFFYITMLSVVVLNMASGIYQNCVFGTGAKFPGIYTNAILIGSNFSGTFTSTVNLISIWLAPEPQKAAIYYFVTALFVILLCIISYNMLMYNPFFKHFDQVLSQRSEGVEIISSNVTSNNETNNDDVPEALRLTVDSMVPSSCKNTQEDTNSFTSELSKKWNVLLKCWPQCFNVFLTFYVTLAMFPAVMANIHQVNSYFSDKYFTSFACFFIFNFFALIGNVISGWTTWPGKDNVWIIVALRLIFVPFFLFCNFNPATRKWSVLINSDTAFIFGNIILAISSGYLSSLCMMFASSGLSPDEAPKAGMLAAFFLVLGIFLGVNSSFLFTWIVE